MSSPGDRMSPAPWAKTERPESEPSKGLCDSGRGDLCNLRGSGEIGKRTRFGICHLPRFCEFESRLPHTILSKGAHFAPFFFCLAFLWCLEHQALAFGALDSQLRAVIVVHLATVVNEVALGAILAHVLAAPVVVNAIVGALQNCEE
jgi:hypothetical protein